MYIFQGWWKAYLCCKVFDGPESTLRFFQSQEWNRQSFSLEVHPFLDFIDEKYINRSVIIRTKIWVKIILRTKIKLKMLYLPDWNITFSDSMKLSFLFWSTLKQHTFFLIFSPSPEPYFQHFYTLSMTPSHHLFFLHRMLHGAGIWFFSCFAID